MKNLLIFVTLSLLLGLSVPVEAQIPVLQNVPVVGAADKTPFRWQLRLRAGQKFLTTTETSSQAVQQLPAMPGAPKPGAASSMENTSFSRVTTEQKVLSSDADGARIEVIYREMTQKSTMRQGDTVLYDSTKPPAGMEGLADLSKSIVGARISYTLSPSGQMSHLQGIEEYLAKLTGGLEKGLPATPEAAEMGRTMRTSLAAMMSPEVMKSALDTTYRPMPTKAVAPGESWEYSLTMPMMGVNFTQNGQSTFTSRNDGVVTLAQKSDFSTDAGAVFKIPLPVPRDKNAPLPVTQLDLHGTSTGEILVDEQSGMTLGYDATQIMQGEIVMSNLTGQGSVLTIPMKVTTKVTVSTHEVKLTP